MAGIKLTKTRVDLIRRKRNAMQKYLRNDIADLLKNDLDMNAYERCEDFLVELNHSRCYDLMDQYCEQISNNLPIMSKQRECPEDCKEAVSTLMFAAARFGDVPELRHLRTVFAERYGNALDCFVNKEFVEKLKSRKPSKDMKLQLMQVIASEWGIDWNSKALEQKLYKPPTIEQESFMNCNDQEAYKLDEKAEKKGENHHLSNRNPEKESEVPVYHNPIPPPYTKSREEKMKGALGRDVDEQKDSDDKEARPKPKSVRRIRTHRALSDEKVGSRDEHSNQRDEEMKKLDSLLEHYSRKNSAGGKPDTETKPSYEQNEASSSSRIPSRRSVDVPPSRSASLPTETQQSSPTELSKGHFRSASYHVETCNPKGHVHPKLPDYDDLVALLAVARASMKE
ncbi:PREDICTED: uncharacterized protein LOC109188208 isoform X2 [Ipomoea nil]|uniref:uncharacterized protein LOC109188208 isoform X2 n=1 Tax=Ipomoea nil TaxID=35883 RepID=UPI000900E887|nr:PREDICTED: uncharacterized protein LOC109188208 isoform X2 [Ipomoea nil]